MKLMAAIALILLSPFAFAQNIWQQVTGAPTSSVTEFSSIAFTPDGHVFAGDAQGTGVWTSSDNGATWDKVNTGIIGTCSHPNGTICVWSLHYDATYNQLELGICKNCDQPSNPNASFYSSSDEGASWTPIAIPSAVGGITNQPSETGAAMGPNGCAAWGGHWMPSNDTNGTFWSCDGFKTTAASTFTSVACSALPGGAYGYGYNPIAKLYIVGTEDCGLYAGPDGKSFTQISPTAAEATSPPTCNYGSPCLPNFGNTVWFSYDNSGNILLAAQRAFWRGTPPASGTQWTWTQIASGAFQNSGLFRDVNGYLYSGQIHDYTNPNMYAVVRSIDQGATWQAYTSGIPLNSCGYNMFGNRYAYNPVDKHLWAIISGTCTGTPNAFIYETVAPIAGGGGTPPNPPTHLTVVSVN